MGKCMETESGTRPFATSKLGCADQEQENNGQIERSLLEELQRTDSVEALKEKDYYKILGVPLEPRPRRSRRLAEKAWSITPTRCRAPGEKERHRGVTEVAEAYEVCLMRRTG